MLKKISYLASLISLFITVGCEEELVAPSSGSSNTIYGETYLVESTSITETNQQVAVFKDSSNSEVISGLRKIEVNNSFCSKEDGHSSGTFSINTKTGMWEGDWTGATNSSGTNIIAVGYNLDDRDQSCEWIYFFPSSQEGKRGTYSAVIYNNRDEGRDDGRY